MNKNPDKILIQQLEDHAKKQNLLEQVKGVVKKLRNIKIFKNKYLIIDTEE